MILSTETLFPLLSNNVRVVVERTSAFPSEELSPAESLPSASEEEEVAPTLWLSDAFSDVEP